MKNEKNTIITVAIGFLLLAFSVSGAGFHCAFGQVIVQPPVSGVFSSPVVGISGKFSVGDPTSEGMPSLSQPGLLSSQLGDFGLQSVSVPAFQTGSRRLFQKFGANVTRRGGARIETILPAVSAVQAGVGGNLPRKLGRWSRPSGHAAQPGWVSRTANLGSSAISSRGTDGGAVRVSPLTVRERVFSIVKSLGFFRAVGDNTAVPVGAYSSIRRTFRPNSGLGANSRSGPSPDLKLADSDREAVNDFVAGIHDGVRSKYPDYDFTKRDYYAWVRFVRFFISSMGIKETLRSGALYVYGDRMEDPKDYEKFEKDLDNELKSLKLSKPDHGKNAAVAKKLLKIAEPDPETIKDDEFSPFRIPLKELVPKRSKVRLILTPTTLRRIESAYRAFSLRDYMLMVGLPATVKSAIPKYLAAEYKIPHMAVTMNPGIGTFELVGGFRPKEVRIDNLSDAKGIVESALREGKKTDNYSALIESAFNIYGGGAMEKIVKAVRDDLDYKPPRGRKAAAETDAIHDGQEAQRRLITLAHGIKFGSASLSWVDGYLTYAIKRDIWITFEEVNAAPTQVLEFLNEFMRSRKLVITEKLGGEPDILTPRENGRFMLWATMNPSDDPNRNILAHTFKNRWRVKFFGELPPLEQAEILEKKFGIPSLWAVALVENFHNPLRAQAIEGTIGADWRDGYEINLRHLLKVSNRWRYFIKQEKRITGDKPGKKRQLLLLAREAYSIYAGMMRRQDEKDGVFTVLDQALDLSSNGITQDDLKVNITGIDDLGDSIQIGDVVLPKGKGGHFVPTPNPDYLADDVVFARLYECAKTLALGEPLLLMGESAAGKTSDVEYLFYRMNRNMLYKNLDSDTAIDDVVGGFTTGKRRGMFVFEEGILPRAMEDTGLSGVFLDEYNLNPLVEWLNTVVDDGRLYLPHRIVSSVKGFALVGAGNPPGPRYEGRIALSRANRSRWTEIWVPDDESVPRLKRLWDHWVRGGTLYSLFLAFLIPAFAAGWFLKP